MFQSFTMKQIVLFLYILILNQASSFELKKCKDTSKCPKGQVLSTSHCFETCDKLWTPRIVNPLKCAEDVCICDNGLVKNENGVCIHPNECPQYKSCLSKNETYVSCAGCQNTCEEPFLQTYCTPLCPQPGCACIEGYLRDEKSGKCVAPQDCPCPPGEIYSAYGNRLDTCQNYWTKYSELPLEEPRPGCICGGGKVRDENGSCINPNDCPQYKTCESKTEEYVGCMPCFENCSHLTSGIQCRPICPNPGCACKSGYARDDATNECIPKEECTN